MAVSVGWAVVLAAVMPRRRPFWEGTVAGLAIAALDLGVIGRHRPQIQELPTLPQVADHIAFGVIAAVALGRREGSRP